MPSECPYPPGPQANRSIGRPAVHWLNSSMSLSAAAVVAALKRVFVHPASAHCCCLECWCSGCFWRPARRPGCQSACSRRGSTSVRCCWTMSSYCWWLRAFAAGSACRCRMASELGLSQAGTPICQEPRRESVYWTGRYWFLGAPIFSEFPELFVEAPCRSPGAPRTL